MKNRKNTLTMMAALVVALTLACVVAQAYVGIDYSYQDAHIMVTDSDAGWAAWVNYDTNAIDWHGPYYIDFYVWWEIPYYDVFYGVFSYNASYGTWSDVIYQVLIQ